MNDGANMIVPGSIKYGKHSGKFGGFGYGTVTQKDRNGKKISFGVLNILEFDKKYKFRYVAKCKAGYLQMYDAPWPMTPAEFISENRCFLENVQYYCEYTNGAGKKVSSWISILVTKGGKFHSIDKEFLLYLKVHHVHQAWKKMADFDLWDRMFANSQMDYAYKPNGYKQDEIGDWIKDDQQTDGW
jgi:hypothetical protein